MKRVTDTKFYNGLRHWCGHMRRYENSRWAKQIESWNPEEKRKRGRPKVRWRDDIEITGGCLWQRLANNRESWKKKGSSYI